MLSVSAAARRLGVCAKTIRRWDAGGQLHCPRTGMCEVQVAQVGADGRR
ncbi:MAG: MerR family transcriptional regulator [Candidatus Thorarchaeota archaeon]